MGLTRIAPTPSGYLHAGNICNFQLTSDLARDHGLTLALRIDDADAARYRRDYVDDIFRVLHDLDIEWQVGPRNTDDFAAHWSQQRRTEFYRTELLSAEDLEVYACTCSRAMVTAPPTGGCPGGCRNARKELQPHVSSLRVHVPLGTLVRIGDASIDLAAAMGDFVIWRRDDLPAYQLVSVLEDRDLGTSHIVRGEDLLVSSAAQVYISRAFGADNVAAATYTHHALVMDENGQKLSKSQISGGPRDA